MSDRTRRLRRREVLTTAGVGMALLAGCSGSGSTDDEDPDDEASTDSNDGPCVVERATGGVSPVAVTAEDAPTGPGGALAVAWNARAQSSMQPDPDGYTYYDAEEGEKYLVVRVRLSNDTGSDLALSDRRFELEYTTPDVSDTVGPLIIGHETVPDVTLRDGGTVSGFLPFALPAEVTEATLRGVGLYSEDDPPSYQFDCARTLDIGVPEAET